MTLAEELASFVVRASSEDLSEPARFHFKVRVLNSSACVDAASPSTGVKKEACTSRGPSLRV